MGNGALNFLYHLICIKFGTRVSKIQILMKCHGDAIVWTASSDGEYSLDSA